MDKDRIAGSAKDIAGKVEGAVGDMTGNGQTQAAGRAREAAGTAQNLYGQAKDAARRLAGRGKNRAGSSARRAVGRWWNRLCAGDAVDASAAPAAAALAILRLSRAFSAENIFGPHV
jgi:uncharacterized protein YjbJ (UPF0337 family)